MENPVASFVSRFRSTAPVVPVLRLAGVIAPSSRFSRGLEEAAMIPLIDKAFKPRRLAAVALAINSPGGSPVQARLIADRIRAAADQRQVPVFAFCEDVAASGGYMLACAADQIFADNASIVGSIGVISSGFGFHDAIRRIGVERRVTTAGAYKSRLDPFKPIKDDDMVWLEDLQARIHRQFTRYVQERRGDRLNEREFKTIFSGDAFVGEQALEYGLIDGLDRMDPFLKKKFGDSVRITPIGRRSGLLARLGAQGAERGGSGPGWAADAASAVAEQAEIAAYWGRYGL